MTSCSKKNLVENGLAILCQDGRVVRGLGQPRPLRAQHVRAVRAELRDVRLGLDQLEVRLRKETIVSNRLVSVCVCEGRGIGCFVLRWIRFRRGWSEVKQ